MRITDLFAEPEAAAGTYGDIEPVLAGLREARQHWRASNWRNQEHGTGGFLSWHEIKKILESLVGALFPLRLGPSFVRPHNEEAFVDQTLRMALSRIYGQVRIELAYARTTTAREENGVEVDREAARIIDRFAHALPNVRRALDEDLEAAFAADPAARSVDEILICYPSALAVIHYRLAHVLHGLGAPLVARLIGGVAHSKTGIDIHPGAKIGTALFIDHGTGLVIGETAEIGDRVRLHQAVTLGAGRFDGRATSAERGAPRHLIVEDDVVIYPGATLLGRIRIGRGAVIGGNVFLTEDVPAGTLVRAMPISVPLP